VPEIQLLAATKRITWEKRRYQVSDLDGKFLVIAATSNTVVNNAVFSQARRVGILCNAVDDPPNCDFYFPAVVRRGDLQIAISTAGESPAFAQKLRRAFEDALSASLGDWLAAIGEFRREILASHPVSEARKRALHVLASGGTCESLDCPGRTAVRPEMDISVDTTEGSRGPLQGAIDPCGLNSNIRVGPAAENSRTTQ
jgi:precorrin-2 dehydrogenase/sirohydrochlorin ferrochelatase